MVPIDMSQYDCPYERNCMIDNNNNVNWFELCHENNL